MSTLITDPFSFPAIPARPARPTSSTNSGLGPRTMARMRQLGGPPQPRRALRDLVDDPHLLDDLGLTREQVLDEADKPFWR